MVNTILSHEGNFTPNRTEKIIIGVVHRTAISGDTALSEATYSHNNIVKASYYKVIDLVGNVIESTLPNMIEWATDDWPINLESLNYEFTGKNLTPLTSKQIAAFIADVKADPASKTIAPHRLTQAEIKTRKVSGWCTHFDITTALSIPGGHVDRISEAELAQLSAGIR